MRLFADNLVKLEESELKKCVKLKEGENFKSGDYVHIFDDIYAEIGKGNILVKEKVNKFNTILREK